MKLTNLAALLRAYFRPAANTTNFDGDVVSLQGLPVPDNSGMWGLLGFMQNVNLVLDMDLVCLASSATAITMTGAQFIQNIFDHSGSPGTGVAVTTPTAAQIIAAMPNTIPRYGINYLLYYINDGLGQTVTLTGGANVTVIGNNTMATNTMRQFLVNVNVNAGTVTMVNIGTQSL